MTVIKSAKQPDESFPLIHKRINKSAVNTDSIEAMTRDTDKMVFGTFINIECPGQPAKICCRYYKGQEYFTQTLEDNLSYKIPLSVARHINERCFHQPHTYIVDEKGQPLKTPKKQFRYKFMIEAA
jgi:hypothetical protein